MIPQVSLTVESMRHTMVAAISEHMTQLDETIREEVAKVCRPENVAAVVYDEADRALRQAIQDAFRSREVVEKLQQVVAKNIKIE